MDSKKLGTQKMTDMICDMLNDLPTIIAEDVVSQMVERVPLLRDALANSDAAEEGRREIERLAERCRALADEAESIMLAMEDVHV